jgi:hypothetical protein
VRKKRIARRRKIGSRLAGLCSPGVMQMQRVRQQNQLLRGAPHDEKLFFEASISGECSR